MYISQNVRVNIRDKYKSIEIIFLFTDMKFHFFYDLRSIKGEKQKPTKTHIFNHKIDNLLRPQYQPNAWGKVIFNRQTASSNIQPGSYLRSKIKRGLISFFKSTFSLV